MNQREIKFRAWIKDKQSMASWRNLTSTEDRKGDLAALLTHPTEMNCVLMQFTGLKDKNGKEIYEGDILRVDGQFIPERMKIGSGLDFHRDILKVYESDMAWMVIGNIYENPELLTN